MCDQDEVAASQMVYGVDWPERMFHMLDNIAARQRQIDTKIEEIRVKQAEASQLSVRMDYVERNLDAVCRRVEGVEDECKMMNGELKTLNAKVGVRAEFVDRDVAEVKQEAKDTQERVISLIKTWGPWVGIGILFAKDLILNLS
jgi:chromosome segregation ATPase